MLQLTKQSTGQLGTGYPGEHPSIQICLNLDEMSHDRVVYGCCGESC